MSDRLNPGSRAAALGAAALARGGNARWDLAEVLAYNSATHTAVLRTHRGAPLRDVPQIKFGLGDYEHLQTGTTVVVTYDLGFPAILGVISLTGPQQTAIDPPSLTGLSGIGIDNALKPTEGSNNYRPPTAPTDMTAGDWARVGDLGQHVAVLEGGLTQLGHPSALVRSSGLSGLLQFIAQKLTTVTDFGTWRVDNDQGKTSFILRAGTTQTTQTGLGEENWTISLDLGATGDIFDFQITDPAGKVLFKMHVGPDGRLEIYGDGGVDISSGKKGNAETRQDVQGTRTTNVGSDDALTIGGARNVVVGKSATENITTDRSVSVGNTEAKFVNSDRVVNVGGQHTDIVAGGGASDAKSGRFARTTKLVNGGWKIDIGNPDDGANISAQAAFELKTSLGDITLNAGAGMKLKAQQMMEATAQLITLNGNTYSIPKWDDFLRDFGQFLTLLMAGLQAGTVGTPVKQQLTALLATIAQLQEFVGKVNAGQPYFSTKVKNG